MVLSVHKIKPFSANVVICRFAEHLLVLLQWYFMVAFPPYKLSVHCSCHLQTLTAVLLSLCLNKQSQIDVSFPSSPSSSYINQLTWPLLYISLRQSTSDLFLCRFQNVCILRQNRTHRKDVYVPSICVMQTIITDKLNKWLANKQTEASPLSKNNCRDSYLGFRETHKKIFCGVDVL